MIEVPFPFHARDAELDWLIRGMGRSSQSLCVYRVEGDIGVGRTRLLEELDQVASSLDHPVYWVGPEPWPVSPPWGAVRSLICALTGLPVQELLQQVGPKQRAGLQLIFGVGDGTPVLARGEAANAVRWALDKACERAPQSVVLLLDDFDHLDGASRNALSDALQMGSLPRLMVVLSHEPGYTRPWLDEAHHRVLQPFSLDAALELLGFSVLGEVLRQQHAESFLPMYLEHLVRFDRDGGTAPPDRLGDLIAARLARLRADHRRVLQAVAVLGPGATDDQIEALVGEGVDVPAASRDLDAMGIFSRDAACFCLAHPLIRRIARAITPAAVLRTLHAKAIEIAGPTLPLELRAFHLQQAADGFGALICLERVGEHARGRDDLESALEAFRIGFELARRSAGDPNLDDPMHAVALFGRKLGETLARMGRYGEAEGILGESLDFASTVPQRARITFALARVARLRRKHRKAIELARQALDLAGEDSQLVVAIENETRRWNS